jgi:tryptophan synthase alpha chain
VAEFFVGRSPRRPGLAVFLTGGDPPPEVLADLVQVLDERCVDCLELAVPFPNSVTDGPVLRRSANRALARGIGLADVLTFVRRVRPHLRHVRIAVLADWSVTVRPLREEEFVRRVAESGADAVLVHGLPPRLRERHLRAAADTDLPVVATCYATSAPDVQQTAARDATAYLYLVARYGRSGSTYPSGYAALSTVVGQLRATTRVPIAVGFGVRSPADVDGVAQAGADAVVVGTAAAAVLEHATETGRDVVEEFDRFVLSMQGI